MTGADPGATSKQAGAVQVSAPAKLTLSLRVTGVRPDGYHELDAEMVALDLHDSLIFEPGTGLAVQAELPVPDGLGEVPSGPDNLVVKALTAVGREARVGLIKRIPPGAGLGGGSSNAAAVLRWAGCHDLAVAARLGADVPFCVVGGRASVRGIGESVMPLPYQERRFVLLLPPFGVNTAAVYRAWDELERTGRAAGRAGDGRAGTNDLEEAALVVEPRLAAWRDRFAEVSGRRPLLAGSGSTWFLEGTPEELGTEGQAFLNVGAAKGALVAVRTVRADYSPSDDT